MYDRDLARSALEQALRVRRDAATKPWEAVCVYDVAAELGIEVRFVDLPSMEGLYLKADRPRIMVSSHRPAGRTAYNCAHELGHHMFGHGSRVDQLLASEHSSPSHDPEEALADLFAGFFLMPKTAVSRGFKELGVAPAACAPSDIMSVAGWLGVGYASLINHMAYSLRLLSRKHAEALLRTSPKRARGQLIGREVDTDVFVANQTWVGRPVDVQVGDYVVLPPNTQLDGLHVTEMPDEQAPEGTSVVCQAKRPGLGRLIHTESGWAAFIRVARRNYVGLAAYRHLEEERDDEGSDQH